MFLQNISDPNATWTTMEVYSLTKSECEAGLFDDYTPSWTFRHSSMHAFSVMLTIGYGWLSAVHMSTRWFAIFFSFISIPAGAAGLSGFAHFLFVIFEKLYLMTNLEQLYAFKRYDSDGGGTIGHAEIKALLMEKNVPVGSDSALK